MIVFGVFFLALLLLLVILLQVRAYYTLKKQNVIITRQSLEIQKQNEELERQNQLLHDLNIEKQQIIGVVSHDLKGPFNRIFALVQLLNMSKKSLTNEQTEYIGKIHQIAVDGLHMVRNLLDSRQIEDQGIEMNLESIYLESFVTSFVKNYKAIADRKSIDLQLQSQGNVSAIADRLYLTRILDNLISNAVKFSPQNKTVVVSIEPNDDFVCIGVKDNGPGISEQDQQNLYMKFRPLSAKPTEGESSTGLGLSIVKSLAEKMNGQISCESKLGEGAKFILSLPKEA